MTARLLSFAPRLALTIGLLVLLAFMVADPRTLVADIARMNAGAFLLAVLLTALDRVVMAFKWWLLLRSQQVVIDLWTTIRAYFATSFAGLFLPVTLGADAIRVIAVRRFGVHDVTASIVVERSIGLIAMATVAIVSCVILATTLAQVHVASLAALVVGVVVVGSAAFLLSIRVAGWWAGRHQGKSSQLVRVAEAYARYQNSRGTLFLFYALSIVECFIPVMMNYVVARGLGFDIPAGGLRRRGASGADDRTAADLTGWLWRAGGLVRLSGGADGCADGSVAVDDARCRCRTAGHTAAVGLRRLDAESPPADGLKAHSEPMAEKLDNVPRAIFDPRRTQARAVSASRRGSAGLVASDRV